MRKNRETFEYGQENTLKIEMPLIYHQEPWLRDPVSKGKSVAFVS